MIDSSAADSILWLDPSTVEVPKTAKLFYQTKRTLHSGSIELERRPSETRAVARAAIFIKKWRYEIVAVRDDDKFIGKFIGKFVSQTESRQACDWHLTEAGLERDGALVLASDQLRQMPVLVSATELLFLLTGALRRRTELVFAAWFPVGDRLFSLQVKRQNSGECSGAFVRLPQKINIDTLDTIVWSEGTVFELDWDSGRGAISAIRVQLKVFGSVELKLNHFEYSE